MRRSPTHKGSAWPLALAALIALGAAPRLSGAETAPAGAALSPEERVAILEEVWSTVDETYYDPGFNGVDWDAVRRSYRPLLDEVAGDEELHRLLTRMVAELRDAHTRYRGPRQRQERRQRVATGVGISVREVERSPAVVAVAPDSAAARAGVEPGMVVRRVNGRPFAELLTEILPEIGAGSSERHARLLAYARVLGGEPGTRLALGLERADGSELEVALERAVVQDSPRFASRVLPSGPVYVRFDLFHTPVAKQLRRALAEHADAAGLILDLRANGGGDGVKMLRVADSFFDREVPVGRLLTRSGKPPCFFLGLICLPLEVTAGRRGGQVYPGPVVVLTSEATASAAETLTNLLQETGRAAVVGTQTCGCALGVLRHRPIRGGGELDVSEIGFISAKGRRLEAAGVTPDEVVPRTLADLRSGRDAALEAAERRLQQQP